MMNKYFICIKVCQNRLCNSSYNILMSSAYADDMRFSHKVDREERPDVDRMYMQYLQATSGGGGWPMSVCEPI
jgi:uncharacterized protein YyaL (SSP411 family)